MVLISDVIRVHKHVFWDVNVTQFGWFDILFVINISCIIFVTDYTEYHYCVMIR